MPAKKQRPSLEWVLHNYSRGMTWSELAAAWGVHPATMEKWFRSKIPPHMRRRTGPRPGAAHKQMWRGGRCLDKHGYILVWAPLHPQANNQGRIREHRAVLEAALGRYLHKSEVVDHKDGCPYHNWPSNLQLFSSNGEHLKAELSGRPKPTPRASIPGAYRSTQKLDRCPSENETLAQCPSEIREKLRRFLDAHRPTPELARLPRRQYLRRGPHRNPFE